MFWNTILTGYIGLTRIPRRFEQILALFIAVPPFLQVCQVVPQIWSWFINLTWIACCWRRKGRGEQSAPLSRSDLSNDTIHYVGLPVLPEGRNSHFYGGTQESAMGLEPNRYLGA